MNILISKTRFLVLIGIEFNRFYFLFEFNFDTMTFQVFTAKYLVILNHILILIALELKSLQKIPEIEFNEMLCYASNKSSCVLAIKEFCRYTKKNRNVV